VILEYGGCKGALVGKREVVTKDFCCLACIFCFLDHGTLSGLSREQRECTLAYQHFSEESGRLLASYSVVDYY